MGQIFDYSVSGIKRNRAEMSAYADTLTEKDILCSIARVTGDVARYDFYDLTLYRSVPCESITYAQYNQTKANANQIRRK